MTTETRRHISTVPVQLTYEIAAREMENCVPTGVSFTAQVTRHFETTGCDVHVVRTKNGRQAVRDYHYSQAPRDWTGAQKIAAQAIDTLQKWGHK